MDKPFRLAIVGAGLITQGSHLPAALASPLVQLVAVVDTVADRAESLARDYGIQPRIATQVDDVLAGLDGAIIATPNSSHKDLAVACLRAGVGVLIEKPLASSVIEGEEILQVATDTGRVVATGYSTRFRENILFLEELLRDGCFGRVRRFMHQFGTTGGWAPLSGYNLRRDSAGGGVLMVTGTHFIDRMLHFWGVPNGAWLEDDSLGGPEANCRAHFRYEGAQPMEGLAVYSKTARLPGGLVIEAERGVVILRDTDDADIVLRPSETPSIEQVIRRRGSGRSSAGVSEFQLQIEDFVQACRGIKPPKVDGQQGLDSLRLIERLYANRKPLGLEWYGMSERQAA